LVKTCARGALTEFDEREQLLVGMLAIGLLGTGSTALVRQATKPALAWQRKAR
jgi:hypothetical protein